jgi:ADYC domain
MHGFAAASAALLAILAAPVAGAAVRSVEVDKTAFVITLDDGSVLPQERLVGVTLTIGDGSGQARRLRIDAVERDAADSEIWLYTLSEQDAASGQWNNICQPDIQGRRLAFPLAGAFDARMRHIDAPGKFFVTCTGGAEGKCVRFGYKPWGRAPDGASLAPYYQTCVRAVRADYCGDGVGHTRNGTPIDIFDRVGVQRDQTAPGMSLEAAFGPDGALCVAHPRLPDEASLARLIELCPRLVVTIGPQCDETAPGLIFIRSRGPSQ